MAPDVDLSFPPSVEQFCQHLNRSLFRSLGDYVPVLARERGSAYLDDFESHLRLLQDAFPAKPWPKWASDGYVALNKAILQEESEFRETGRYSAGVEDLEQVKHDIYDNPAVMERFYLVGLYCTYFLWPHHVLILDYFRREFLGSGDAPSTCAEWGVGHGMLTLEALRAWPAATSVLADLSPHSLGFSQSLLTAAGLWPRCSAILGDVLTTPLPAVDRLICSELLEHVPDPMALLARVRECLTPTGRVYLTGAINAPQPDHVFLIRTARELLNMARSAGLEVFSHLAVCHPSRAGDPQAPTVLALVAGRDNRS